MTADDNTIQLVGDIPIENLAAIRDEIGKRLGAGPLSIETADLTHAPLPLVQLIYAAHRTAAAQGGRLTVACPPDTPFSDALEGFGFLNAAAGAARVEGDVWVGLETHEELAP
ncbi:STAS domain-containing protein [Acuticoccus sp. M5D2P5]|uniref:STAS domain-containing protein n=1 Tax=Acuticoccus kalidii TaxID=2910977 RepID=UPI001F169995|nr:STAS domain-containing protein [Acuticoccus kalidii]MCF3932952.1 STAS domain-containing protein [Acuticoccus kalidii]